MKLSFESRLRTEDQKYGLPTKTVAAGEAQAATAYDLAPGENEQFTVLEGSAEIALLHDEFAKLRGQKTGLLHITNNPGLHDLSVIEREHKLKEKPQAFLKASFSAAVPNLQAGDLSLDENLDIMFWALEQSVPHGLLSMPDTGHTLIAQNDGSFKAALDHTKYATCYPDLSPQIERTKGSDLILTLNIRLIENEFLTVDSPTLADIAIFPFLRQFANIDWTWFDAQPWPQVILWLDGFLQSAEFQTIMTNIPVWQEGASPYIFGHYFE